MKPFRSAFVFLAMLVVGYGSAFSQQFFSLAFDGNDVSQPVTTPATGSGWAILSADKSQLAYTFAYAKLSGRVTVAHFHYSKAGLRNPTPTQSITVSDTATSGYVTGSWAGLTAAQADSLLSGAVYINLHTAANPAGEIRAQVNPVAGTGYVLALSGANQNPVINTPARGAGYAVLWSDSTLRYHMTFAGLLGPVSNAHFHKGPAGTSGVVAQAIQFTATDNTLSGSWKLTPNFIDSLRRELYYVNVHTTVNPAGEIRAQVRNPIGQFFSLAFDGNDISQPVTTPALGSGWAVMNATRTQINYTFAYAKLSGRVTVAHFHYSKAGLRNPTPTQSITVSDTATSGYVTGSWAGLTAAQADSLLSGAVYINLHTAANPAGEIRAQVNPVAGTGYVLALSGANQNPVINTPARGAGYAVLWSDSTLRYHMTFAGLLGPVSNAHFHKGPAGTSGVVAQAIQFTATDNTLSGSWKLTPNFIDSLRRELYYVNVHTTVNPAGEIRAQVRPPNFTAVSVRQVSTLDAVRLNVQISPNPSTEMVTMNFALAQSGKASLRLYDALGRAVSEAVEGVWAGGNASAQFNVSNLNNGVYYCRITLLGGETAVQGFVVAR